MMNKTNIDNYFNRVKQNPPLMELETVYQIISSPAAPARLKGKPGKLLKFTVMTSIFVVLFSALMLWPEKNPNIDPNKVENNKAQTVYNQKPDSNKQDVTGANVPEKTITVYKSRINDKADRLLSLPEAKNNPSENEVNNQLHEQAGEIDLSTPFYQTLPDEKVGNPVDPKLACLQPTDGNRFILRLSNEELKQLGFEVTDTSYSYRQQIGERGFHYGFSISRRIITSGNPDENRKEIVTTGHTEFGFDSYKTALKNQVTPFDFYPVFKTNMFYSEVESNDLLTKEDFSTANDTLLAVVLPVSNLYPSIQDRLIWFTTTDKFFSVLLPKHKELIEEFKQYKAAAKVQSKKDLIVYQAPKLFDETKVVTLTKNELIPLGFRFYPDSTIFSGSIAGLEIEYFKSAVTSRERHIQGSLSDQYNNLLAVMVTRTDGSPYATFDQPVKVLNLGNNLYGSQFPLLIPVLLKSSESLFGEDVLFWFYPTDKLFDTLPSEIGEALKNEYNYVTAKDKSTVAMPECRYFEACKNTLPVSDFKVYPNPANQQITVSFHLPEPIGARIMLVDLSGRELQMLLPTTNFSEGQHNIELDISFAPKGIYLLTLYSEKGTQTERLIVTR